MILLGESHVGTDCLVATDVVIGHPSKQQLLSERDFGKSRGASVGARSILRSGTVIYEDALLGDAVQTAHHVVIREGARIGDGCVFGNGAVVREAAVLGRNVRCMENVVIAEGSQVGNDVFIGPNVSLTAGRHMTGALQASGRMSHQEATALEGAAWEGAPIVIGNEARIGANAVLLAGIRIGDRAVVAAGTVVSSHVPDGAMMAGNPGRLLRSGTPS